MIKSNLILKKIMKTIIINYYRNKRKNYHNIYHLLVVKKELANIVFCLLIKFKIIGQRKIKIRFNKSNSGIKINRKDNLFRIIKWRKRAFQIVFITKLKKLMKLRCRRMKR